MYLITDLLHTFCTFIFFTVLILFEYLKHIFSTQHKMTVPKYAKQN